MFSAILSFFWPRSRAAQRAGLRYMSRAEIEAKVLELSARLADRAIDRTSAEVRLRAVERWLYIDPPMTVTEIRKRLEHFDSIGVFDVGFRRTGS